MSTSAFIGVRVSAETKELVRSLAESEKITESALVKQLLEVMLRTSALRAPSVAEPPHTPSQDARIKVRLRPDDRLLLASRAKERGLTSATYVSVLVRAHLRNVTPLPKEELLALKQSIAELRAIGRNLNQMSRALNQGQHAALGTHEVMSMLKVAEALRVHFKGLLIANQRSWEQGHAGAPG
jgi:hypothetical protein